TLGSKRFLWRRTHKTGAVDHCSFWSLCSRNSDCRSPRLFAATHVPPLAVKMAFSNGNLSVRGLRSVQTPSAGLAHVAILLCRSFAGTLFAERRIPFLHLAQSLFLF